jgi:hypothetical protein
MKTRTPAELQMEELRRLRETLAGRKPAAVPRPKVPAPTGPEAPRPSATSSGTVLTGLEISEASKVKKSGPSLPVSKALYRQLLERQRIARAFKRRRDMGDWAAELLLALPFEAHKLSPEAKAELFKRMQEWAQARGLR